MLEGWGVSLLQVGVGLWNCVGVGGECMWRGGEDVLIRGSWPGPFFARFCSRVEDEKLDVVAGVGCSGLWAVVRGTRVDGRKVGALNGRNTGRKGERFMVVAVPWEGAQWRMVVVVMLLGLEVWKFAMGPRLPRG